MQEQVRALAFYDPLTQLPNRRLVLDRLTQEIGRARRLQHRLALLFIDLDNFKPVNDELGHAVGDWLLNCVAQRIQGCLRESDTAARLGGDEFVVLLPDLQSNEAALGVAQKIRLEIAREFVTSEGASLSISSSIGVALYPDHALNEKDLMHLGDEAMYLAKKAGRNAVVLCTPHLS
jgi:diguanylate cyclase (GGDEF)-like protein